VPIISTTVKYLPFYCVQLCNLQDTHPAASDEGASRNVIRQILIVILLHAFIKILLCAFIIILTDIHSPARVIWYSFGVIYVPVDSTSDPCCARCPPVGVTVDVLDRFTH